MDVGCGTGAITAALMKKYRKARVIGLDSAPALVNKACKQAPWLRTLHGAVAEPEALPLPSASCDLVFSHFALPWCLDLDRVFAGFQRVLKPGGVLLFSTLGPDTLIELRRSWAAADGYNPVSYTHLDVYKRQLHTMTLFNLAFITARNPGLPLWEVVLTITDNLTAYRRRYRSALHPRAIIDLLLFDEGNPRAIGYQLQRLQRNIRRLQRPNNSSPYRSAEERLILSLIHI